MSIKNRILFSSIISLALFMVLGTLSWNGTNTIVAKSNNAYLLKNLNMHLQGLFRGINEFIIDEAEPISIELTNSHIDGFEETHNTLLSIIKDPDLLKTLNEKITPQWNLVRDGAKKFMKDNPWINADDDNAMLQYGKLTTEATKLLKDVEIVAKDAQEVAKAVAKKTVLLSSIVAIIILVLLTFLLFNLFRSINSPIKDLTAIAKGFSNGDLSHFINKSRKDEFGALGAHFNLATEKLNDMMLKVRKVTEILSLNSKRLLDSARQISNNADEQSSQTTQAATAMEELSASFTEVAQNTTDAAQFSKEAAALATKGGSVVLESIKGMNNIARSVNESALTIEALGIRSEQIGAIIKVINDIAGQTNLLALNAAIEAARAGEQGRGFAVVADEVRKLAERTTKATNEIGDMIKGFQNDILKAVESMQAGTREVEAGVGLSNLAGDSLKQIVESAQSVTNMVQQIATAAEEQSSTGEIVASNVESVASLTYQTAENAKESSHAAQDMNQLVLQLTDLISEFKLRDQSSGPETDESELIKSAEPEPAFDNYMEHTA